MSIENILARLSANPTIFKEFDRYYCYNNTEQYKSRFIWDWIKLRSAWGKWVFVIRVYVFVWIYTIKLDKHKLGNQASINCWWPEPNKPEFYCEFRGMYWMCSISIVWVLCGICNYFGIIRRFIQTLSKYFAFDGLTAMGELNCNLFMLHANLINLVEREMVWYQASISLLFGPETWL